MRQAMFIRLPCLKWLLVCGAIGAATCASSSAHAEQQNEGAFTAPAYKVLRYEEDYRYLQDLTKRTDPWDPIKYIPIGADPSIYLSLGGELRERFEYYSHPNFGLLGGKPNGYLLHRLLLHADLHVGEYFRSFVQFGSYLAPGKDNAAPPYLNQLDLQQAFVDIRLPFSSSAELDPTLRIGRQELAFGSQRLVALRDVPNVRRNFDGFRLSESVGEVHLDAFLTRPVLQKSGVFDDPSNQTESFWGVYATTPVNFFPGGDIDLYYFGFENEHAVFAAGSGNERRHSIGTRLFGAKAVWDWDWEAVGQFGTFAGQDIRAWTIATNTGYTFNVGNWKMRFGVKADVASGDRNPHDGTLGTFNALFPKLGYLSSAALFTASNIMDVQPTLSIKPTESLTLTLGFDSLWRVTTNDAVYNGFGAPVKGTAGRPDLFSGHTFSGDLAWQVDRHFLIEAGYVHVETAGALRAAGGRNVDFTYASASYKF